MNVHAFRHDTGLTREHYVDPAIYALELERVFRRQWLCVGHVSDVPGVGNYFSDHLVGERIIVVRSSESRIQAFLNVCRHRGHHVCSEARGRAKVFTCPYHQWTYNLDGSLKRAPGFADGEDIDLKSWGLHEVELGIWNGFIFVWLGKRKAKPIAECFAFDNAGLAKLEPEHMKEVGRERYRIASNWKVLLENYLECYHCHGSHPELCVTMDVEATYKNTDEDWKGEYFAGPVQLYPGKVTASMTGALVSKPLGELAGLPDPPAGYGGGAGVLPSLSRIIFHVDHAVMHVLRPIDVAHVGWETRWYVSADAVEGVDYKPETVTEVWRLTNAEDIALCESTYRGVCSERFVPGPLHPRREGAVRPTLDTYLALMATP